MATVLDYPSSPWAVVSTTATMGIMVITAVLGMEAITVITEREFSELRTIFRLGGRCRVFGISRAATVCALVVLALVSHLCHGMAPRSHAMSFPRLTVVVITSPAVAAAVAATVTLVAEVAAPAAVVAPISLMAAASEEQANTITVAAAEIPVM